MRTETEQTGWIVFVREQGPRMAGSVFLALTCFTLTLEFRTWIRRVELDSLAIEQKTLAPRSRMLRDREEAYERLVILQTQLEEWKQARQVWAGSLVDLFGSCPSNLAIQRLTMQQPLSGSYRRPDSYLPARFVPQRFWELRVAGEGLDGSAAESITRLTEQMASADEAALPLRALQLTGIESFEADGRIHREFNLHGAGRIGRAETTP